MLLDIFVYVALFGGVGLAIYSVFRRIKNTDPDTAGYVYNGKQWVTWVFVLVTFAILFYVFIMPIPLLSGQSTYRPDWGWFGLFFYALLLYICYSVIAFVPATADELKESESAGKQVMSSVGTATASVFAVIFSTIWAIILSIPSMISHALNPVLGFKRIGGKLYKIVGNGIHHTLFAILGIAIVAILAFMVIMFATLFFAIFGTFALGIFAVVKFVMNNFFYKKPQPVAQAQPVDPQPIEQPQEPSKE